MRRIVDRRRFLQATAAAAAGASWAGLSGRRVVAAETLQCSTPTAEKIGWPVACQLYTFRRFSFYEALEMIAKLGVAYVEPCFFLALDGKRPELKTGESLSPPLRKEMQKRMADFGISMPNYYAGIGADRDAAVKAFEFAKEMGVETIVAEPPAAAFDMVEKLCDQYEINLAVHNHPKSPSSHYWNPESVLAVCQGRGKRIGGCCDTGHWVRSALNPIECLKKMEGRIVTFHLKDIAEWGKPEARDVPLGTGLADYAGVLKELKRQGFRGVMSLEYEHDSPKLLEEVAQCLAFVEKTAGELSG
ncbi:MAG TPA: sugar phosphate isomerase/epimerase family protein [Thermoguttaceae bacterium]|nr:sugar phosphate isomerase/epimerase family protein [Thermoguttaceae bacterium]